MDEKRRSPYPPHWTHMRLAVLARAGYRCEGAPQYPDCRAENGKPHPVTGSIVVLTTAHKHGTSTMTQDLADLMALCQRCHLAYDREMHQRHAAATRLSKRLATQQSGGQWGQGSGAERSEPTEDELRAQLVRLELEDLLRHGDVECALSEIIAVFPRADGRCPVPGCTSCTPTQGATPLLRVLGTDRHETV